MLDLLKRSNKSLVFNVENVSRLFYAKEKKGEMGELGIHSVLENTGKLYIYPGITCSI